MDFLFVTSGGLLFMATFVYLYEKWFVYRYDAALEAEQELFDLYDRSVES